ncbi:MAG: DNA ligase D [Acidobacteriaceae bacterium]|nr:DNA ligase D [Acidobacteriaceae bacterium]
MLTGRSQEEIAADLPAHKTAEKKIPNKASSSKKKARKFPDGAVKAEMPAWLEPMQAESATQAPPGDEWLYEIKWDGVRALVFLGDEKITIYSRRGNRCDLQYPELTVLPHYVTANTAILDGEIAVLDDNGRPSFAAIQPRIHQTDPNSIAHLARKSPATLFLFDLVYLDGYDLCAVPLSERKKLLEQIVTPSEHIKISGHFAGAGAEMMEAARQNGLEGVMAKRANSKYETRRSWNWLKLKIVNQQEFVICGFVHEGNRSYFSSLVLGLYDSGKLVHCGQVGTGFNDKTLPEIFHRLEPLITDKSAFGEKIKDVQKRKITWVRPELVCEVRFQQFTRDGILRAPVFLGLRPDRDPQDCVREPTVDGDSLKLEAEPKPEPVQANSEPERPAPPVEQKFNNLNKVFYPKDGVTKGDVIQYYDDVSEWILPHLKDRPLSLKRYPNGIHADFFFQKNVGNKKFPAWIKTEAIDDIEYAICNDKPALLYLANLGCIDQNPWMSRIHSLDNPDFILIDLDPYECSFDLIIEAALLTKSKLDQIGLQGYPKTTGGDGLHVYIPVEPIYTYDQVRTFAEVLWHLVVAMQSTLFTTPRAVAQRKKGRVYFDYLQIGRSKTIAAPYVLRAHDGAPVATPLGWKEVKKGLTPGQFNIRNAMARFRKNGDLFKGVLTNLQRIEEPLEKLAELVKSDEPRSAR